MWKKLTTSILLRHPRLTVVEDEVRIPNGKTIQYIHFTNSSDAAIVICFKNKRLLLQKEYSYPPNEILYQFPGGAIEKGELPLEAARRELHEEADLLADTLQPIGSFYINNRRSNAKMYVFLATNPKDDKGMADDEEDIISEWVSVIDFQKMIQKGEIRNFSMLAAWALYTARFR